MQEQHQIEFWNNEEESSNQRSSISSTLSTCNEANKQKTKRSRTTFNSEQLMCFERFFKKNRYLTKQRRIEMAINLKLPEKQIKIWFQNRRMKHKKENEKPQSTIRSAEFNIERPSNTAHETQNNDTAQSSMWTPNATYFLNRYFNNVPNNNNYFTTLNYKNISHFQQEGEQNYFQPAIESVVPAQQMQSSYNVLQNDMSSPYNQYVSYQTDYSDATPCSQQEMYNYQQQWNNYPNAQSNVDFSSENLYMNKDNNYTYNNVAQTQNNYTCNNSVMNDCYNENISAAPQESVDTPHNFEDDFCPFLETILSGTLL